MRAKSFSGVVLVLILLVTSSEGAVISASEAPNPGPVIQEVSKPNGATVQSSLADQAIIIDHNCTDLDRIPEYWIGQAQTQLDVYYGHTSHGSQPITGMDVLGIPKPPIHEYGDDLGENGDTSWVAPTRNYLNSHPETNVVVWSWCGGVSGNTETGINAYLSAMNQLEQDYPGVTFVYMTGHLDGGGEAGNLNVRNNQIRDYCIANNKVLFDFADIESYDPDGDYFLDLYANDYCSYNGGNWANEWCAEHPGDPLCASCGSDDCCAHSRPLNCNLKGRAFWWMLTRIAGWAGTTDAIDGTAQKAASAPAPSFGEAVTYTITLRNLTVPPTATVALTDVLPAALSYITNTLTATTGTPDDIDFPTLHWSGPLSPTPAVTITYAATVTVSDPQVITNTVFIGVQGYQTISRTATVIANAYPVYLPLTLRQYSP